MNNITIDDNPVLKEILTEMCKRVKVSYKDIDFKEEDWYMKHTWTEKEQEEFMEWMEKYLLEDKKRIDNIAQFPSIVKHNKKELKKLINWFIVQYGWRCSYA